jgi:hypothetical protein
MLVTLLRVFTWLAAVYAVSTNVVAIGWACTTLADPWAQIAAWYSPLNFANWRHEAGLFAPALASHYVAGWLSARR